MPRITLEKMFDEHSDSPGDTHEKFEKALRGLAPTLNSFRWESRNIHLRTVAIAVSDEVNIEVVYDESYYRGPGPAVILKKTAIKNTAAVIAEAYARIDDYIARISSVNVGMIPTNGDSTTPIIFYSLKPHLAGF